MQVVTKAIVLRRIDYQENDEILKVYTKEYGLLSFLVRGAKKLSNKNRSSLNEFFESEITFDYQENKEFFTLIKAQTLEVFVSDYDLDSLVYFGFVNEVIYSFIQASDNNYYDLLKTTYKLILSEKIIGACFLIKEILRLEGLSPQVDHCVFCEQVKVVDIDYENGGFVCEKHAHHHLDLKTLRKFRFLNKANATNVLQLQPLNYDYQDLAILMKFIEANFQWQFKSLELIRQLS